MKRRTFIAAGVGVTGALFLKSILGSRKAAYAESYYDTPRSPLPEAGKPAEFHKEAKLPTWPGGGDSALRDSMLMFRGNPSHNHYGVGEIPNKKPRILWQYRLPDFSQAYYGTPFVWRGTGWTGQPMAYEGYIWIGTQGRNLFCFDAMTGEVQWRYQAGRQFKGSGCFWDNKIYIGNVDDLLRCLDAKTGNLLWYIDTGRDLDSSPCVSDGALYIAGENGHVRCLDPLSGKKHWRSFIGGLNLGGPHPGSYGSETSPAVIDDEVYAATYDGLLWCLDRKTGEPLWKANTGDDTDSSPVISEDMVFIGAQDKNPYVFAFSRKDGKEIWRKRAPGGVWGTVAVKGEQLYVGSAGGPFYALEKRTGKVLWERRLPYGTWSSACVLGDKLLIGDRGGNLNCLLLSSGKRLWSMPLGGRVHSTPIVYRSRIYVGSTAGNFYALEGI